MTTSGDTGPPWTWEHPVGVRWLLAGDVDFEDAYDDVPLALCVEVEGLFVDLPPRPRERFTLLGCTRTVRSRPVPIGPGWGTSR
ncbi:MAG TPA: hypothetical protein VNO31_07775 [Umezawaea sp.]|nr:hypothetical protein [Umezawaea sp.]